MSDYEEEMAENTPGSECGECKRLRDEIYLLQNTYPVILPSGDSYKKSGLSFYERRELNREFEHGGKAPNGCDSWGVYYKTL